MIFAHATKTGKAQTALFELARMVIHGHLMQRILTPMRSALVLVFVIERLASASALQVSLAMLANAVSYFFIQHLYRRLINSTNFHNSQLLFISPSRCLPKRLQWSRCMSPTLRAQDNCSISQVGLWANPSMRLRCWFLRHRLLTATLPNRWWSIDPMRWRK